MGLYSLRSYNAATPSYHQAADATRYRATDGDFVVGCCVWLNSLSGTQFFVAKNGAGSNDSYILGMQSSNWYWVLTNTLGADATINSVSATASTFVWLVAYYSSTEPEVGLIVNAGTPVTAAFSGTPRDSSSALSVSGYIGGSAGVTGRIGRVFFARPAASTAATAAAIATAHYNSGQGLLYAETTQAQRSSWGIVSWWDGNVYPSSLVLVDQHGGYNLDDFGSPGLSDGPEPAGAGAYNPFRTPYQFGALT